MSIMEGQKLRSDLVVSRQPQKGQVIFVIKDPVNSQYFRLNEPDYFIAAQLDGQRRHDRFGNLHRLKPQVGLSGRPQMRHWSAREPDRLRD